VFGLNSNEEILKEFQDVDTDPDIKYIQNTLEKDASQTADEGYKEVYKRVRPGDLATVENARSLIDGMFFNTERYDFSAVGRYKFNQRMNLPKNNNPLLTKEDLVLVVKEIIRLNNTQESADDIDHLANRRIRAVGELIQARFRVCLARMARIAKDRMSLADLETVSPVQLIHVRPIAESLLLCSNSAKGLVWSMN
jgi:DNA-directed RNA polymerase subunit beta